MLVQGLPVFHITAALDRRDVDLSSFDVAAWLWPRLRASFPLALAACLMPDHPHLVAPFADPEAARKRLNRMLGQLARRLGLRQLGRTLEPKRIADRGKLLRDVRYVGLNPPRKRLVRDPLSWLFSTHRDVVGAVVDPWVDSDRMAAAVGRPRTGFADWYHGYVSSDPDVALKGTPPPESAAPTDVAALPLATVARAVAAAHRVRPSAIRRASVVRDHFVVLAFEQGWRNLAQLASACECTPWTIRHIAARVDGSALGPARLCLGDGRLLAGAPRWEPGAGSPRVVPTRRWK